MKRTITIEFDRVKITTAQSRRNLMRCELCGSQSEFIDEAQAALAAQLLETEGVAVRRENLHFYESPENQVLICLNSIIRGNNPNI